MNYGVLKNVAQMLLVQAAKVGLLLNLYTTMSFSSCKFDVEQLDRLWGLGCPADNR